MRAVEAGYGNRMGSNILQSGACRLRKWKNFISKGGVENEKKKTYDSDACGSAGA